MDKTIILCPQKTCEIQSKTYDGERGLHEIYYLEPMGLVCNLSVLIQSIYDEIPKNLS